MKPLETQLHEDTTKRKLQLNLITKDMKSEDQTAVIKTKDSLRK